MRLADGVLLARDVIQEFLKKNGTLSLPIPVLGEKGLLSIISNRAMIPITAKCLPWSGQFCFGRLNRYKDRAEILYSSSLNTCWSRFVICKEAIHLLCDEKSYSADPITLVTALINEIPPGISEEIDAERIAIYGAMELLVPKEMSKHLYQMEVDKASHYEIAVAFRVPEKIISLRLSPAIKELADRMHNDMHPK